MITDEDFFYRGKDLIDRASRLLLKALASRLSDNSPEARRFRDEAGQWNRDVQQLQRELEEDE